jgi:hypothetical protein
MVVVKCLTTKGEKREVGIFVAPARLAAVE